MPIPNIENLITTSDQYLRGVPLASPNLDINNIFPAEQIQSAFGAYNPTQVFTSIDGVSNRVSEVLNGTVPGNSLDVLNQFSGDPTTALANNETPNVAPVLYYPDEIYSGSTNKTTPDAQSIVRNVIRFDIFDYKGARISSDAKSQTLRDVRNSATLDSVLSAGKSAISGIGDAASSFIGAATNGDIGNITGNLKDALFTSGSTISSNLSNQTTFLKFLESSTVKEVPDEDMVAQIYLNCPEELSANYSMAYTDLDFTATDKAAEIIRAVAKGENSAETSDILRQLGVSVADSLINNTGLLSSAIKSIVGGEIRLKELVNLKTRTVPFQNLEYLFQRVQRRTFDFSFDFYPKSLNEINQVKRIINTIKKYAHPEFSSDSHRYLNMPALFKATYLYYDSTTNTYIENKHLNRIKLSSLDSVNINYSNAGTYSTFGLSDKDGKPAVGIKMDIKLTELELLSRGDIEMKDNSSNKGYY